MPEFIVTEAISDNFEKGIYLVPDNWDDWFEYETAFWLWLKKEKSSAICMGRVKIARKNQTDRKTRLPKSFYGLSKDYFSVGFNEDYYENLKQTPDRESILVALHDIAFDLSIYEEVKEMHVTQISFMREYTETRLRGQIHRMAIGGARLTDYNFVYRFPFMHPVTGEKIEMDFAVEREKKPSSNIHVMIGKNGSGKTTIIKKMIYALENCKTGEENGEMLNGWDSNFSNVVSVSFSAFDTPIFEANFADEFPIPYKFVGLVKEKSIKSTTSLTEEFMSCSFRFYENSSKMRLWRDTIEILKSDYTFAEKKVDEWLNENYKNEWIKQINSREFQIAEKNEYLMQQHKVRVYDSYGKLSSGHKIILLTLANLIELVEEKTLVLLDEPEEHLHPPLVAAFMRALTNLLVYRNGVGIIATHSPVIVQEVPRKCVWILQRTGDYLIPRRPEIETYGENLGDLTSEIFGYEVTNSGFHKELQEAVEKSDSFDEAEWLLGNQLGKEAKSILRAYMYNKEKGNNA